MPESVRLGRQPPTTGPLPAGGDLSETFAVEGAKERELKDHEKAEDRRVGGPSRRKRRKPAKPSGSSPVSTQVAADPSESEQEAQRRRAAFRVIDGGG